MADQLVHRGPDDAGVWVDKEAGISLGHRRLSILDLSPHGRQPMVSANGRYILVYNGEIYNHGGVRKELENFEASPNWRGHSDTEVMLAAFEYWGVKKALARFNGMFSFALWDRRHRALHLARDRFGEKPLYYGWVGDTFICGSELKALKVHPSWHPEIDRGAVALYIRHNYIPGPYSIYRGISKLLPGHFLSIRFSQGKQAAARPRPYWIAKNIAESGVQSPITAEPRDVVESLDDLLRDAVGLRMEADVPLGAFLSGGYDSSTVVALMQAQSSRPIRTFSIGFHESDYNEAKYAKAVAQHLQTDHTELYVTPEEAMAVIPRIPKIYDEPFSDSSQIPTFLVSEMTRRHVTVALSGDGGDEVFGGYERYTWARKIWWHVGWLPKSARSLFSCALTSISPDRWDRVFSALTSLLPRSAQVQFPGDKLHKLAQVLASRSSEELYLGLVSHWIPDSVVLAPREPPTILTDHKQWAELTDFTQRMMYLDLVSYLPDDILVKVDRASMAVSLEARVPMLDHRVVEFAWKIPQNLKFRDGKGKWILRQVLHRYVPTELMDRPKMGFGVPIDKWLRGPLKDWAEDLLNESRIREEGNFNPTPIRDKWREHVSGKRNWAYHLWDVLMFEAWLESQGEPACVESGGNGMHTERING